MIVLKKIYEFFLSLKTSLWLLGLITLLFIAGAVIMPSHPEYSSINIPLFKWLAKQPLGKTWWLWGCVGVLVIMAVNTLFCSIESIIKKRKATQWLLLISPQIIHIGFLLMLLAHFLGAMESFHVQVGLYEGQRVKLSETEMLRVDEIDIELEESRYISDWSVEVSYLTDEKVTSRDTIRPNDPSLHNDLNIIGENVKVYPKAVLLKICRDPGAVWALAGGIFFTVGILILIGLRIKMEKK